MIRTKISRLLWRSARRTMARPSGTAQAEGIERFSVFQGTLHIRGTLSLPAPGRSLVLELPGGEALPIEVINKPGGFRFDQVIRVPAPAAELAAAVLVATLNDGTKLRLANPGAATADPAHDLAVDFRHRLRDRPPGRVLEIGARARSGNVRRDWVPDGWEYSGFDIMAGPNVDVVGDAHSVSRHYPPASFDAVMAFSVVEHLLMPWKAVVELNRVLKPGALGLFSTHQTWPMHDEPWDFWRFSDAAWTALLNPATGFEILAARLGEPAYVVAQRCSPITAFPERPAGALASLVLFRKTADTTLDWPVNLEAILSTRYPQGEVRT